MNDMPYDKKMKKSDPNKPAGGMMKPTKSTKKAKKAKKKK